MDTPGAFTAVGLAGGLAVDLLLVVFAGVLAGSAAAFGAVTLVAEGLGAVVFGAAVVLEGAGFAVDPAGPVVPVAGLGTWPWGVLPVGLPDSLFILTSSMISIN